MELFNLSSQMSLTSRFPENLNSIFDIEIYTDDVAESKKNNIGELQQIK